MHFISNDPTSNKVRLLEQHDTAALFQHGLGLTSKELPHLCIKGWTDTDSPCESPINANLPTVPPKLLFWGFTNAAAAPPRAGSRQPESSPQLGRSDNVAP